jgi:hypothetical protein
MENGASAIVRRAVEEQFMVAAPFLNGHVQRAPVGAMPSSGLHAPDSGATNGGAPGTSISETELTRIANEVYTIIEQRLTVEREALGY